MQSKGSTFITLSICPVPGIEPATSRSSALPAELVLPWEIYANPQHFFTYFCSSQTFHEIISFLYSFVTKMQEGDYDAELPKEESKVCQWQFVFFAIVFCLFVCLHFNLFLSSFFLIFCNDISEINVPFPPPKKNNKSNNDNINEGDFCSQSRVLPHLFREGTCLPLDLFKVYQSNTLHFC